MSAIVVSDLHKHYGETRAVAGIDLEVAPGEVFALLGPNGAGKTTTVEILEGHRRRSRGDVSVLGHDPETGGRAFRERIGIVLQEPSLEAELTVAEVVTTYAAFYPHPMEAERVIDIVGLTAKSGARIKTLSGGQRRRLELALGIVGDPDLIFLDEPTTGFDPSARRQAWGLIERLKELGKTIVLTTHYMDEAQHLADRVAVVAAGRIVAEGDPQSLAGRQHERATIRFRIDPEMAQGLSSLEFPVHLDGDRVSVQVEETTRALHALTGWALAGGGELHELTVTRPSLEEIYLQLTAEDVEPGT